MDDSRPWTAPAGGGTRASAKRSDAYRPPPAAAPAPEFPGCKPRRLPRGQIEHFEGRIEFWDADTEIAWVAEPTSPYHEQPVETLSALADRVAAVRGSPIKCYGSMDLWLRDEHGKPRRILQADQSVYLHPKRAVLPGLSAMVIGDHDFPDIVLEVDHSTDVRRGKLGLYESWGFPEVWVEVPDRRASSRARTRKPGLTIHLLSDDRAFRVSPESRAFPGWRAEDIHTALNETTASERTYAILERIGKALGAREGTGPDDDPWLRSQRRESFRRGHFRGRAEGRAEGHAEGRSEGRSEGHSEGKVQGRVEARAGMARRMLLSRGVEISEDFPANVPAFADSPEEAIVTAALACESETDFQARLRRRDR